MSEKVPSAVTSGQEPSHEEINSLCKGKASASCSSGLPLVADVAVFSTFIMCTVNAILYNSLISIQSLLAILSYAGSQACQLLSDINSKLKI